MERELKKVRSADHWQGFQETDNLLFIIWVIERKILKPRQIERYIDINLQTYHTLLDWVQ